MAELRKWRVDFSDEGSLASKQLASPPGYDASSAARSQVHVITLVVNPQHGFSSIDLPVTYKSSGSQEAA